MVQNLIPTIKTLWKRQFSKGSEKRQPCTRCGECCLTEPCLVSATFCDKPYPCPALIKSGSQFTCGMMQDPHKYTRLLDIYTKEQASSMVKKVLALGKGCEAPYNTSIVSGGDHFYKLIKNVEW